MRVSSPFPSLFPWLPWRLFGTSKKPGGRVGGESGRLGVQAGPENPGGPICGTFWFILW
jgi:hypothetical protein